MSRSQNDAEGAGDSAPVGYGKPKRRNISSIHRKRDHSNKNLQHPQPG
ncbi:MAG: hypothetical protein WCS37_00040 [Chloroflexota bacterium]|nr:hypothetical protein [Chloroflexota bacterium]